MIFVKVYILVLFLSLMQMFQEFLHFKDVFRIEICFYLK